MVKRPRYSYEGKMAEKRLPSGGLQPVSFGFLFIGFILQFAI